MADHRVQKNEKASPDEWYTPRYIIDALGPFDLDPCAPMEPPFEIAPMSYNQETDGLAHEWPKDKFVWLNPPYSKVLLKAFVAKLVEHNNGIALLVNRTDNVMFLDTICNHAKSMIFLRHRIKFLSPSGDHVSPMFGSILVAFGDNADERLRKCGLEGKYVVLN